MLYLINLMMSAIEKYGAFGFGIANLFVVLFFGHKLFTNHLAHLAKDLQANTKAIDLTNTKIDSLSKITNKNAERISHIEGKLSE